MDGASRIQQAGVSNIQASTSPISGQGAQNGKVNGERVRVETNASSAMLGVDAGDAEEIAIKLANKQHRKLNIKSGKSKETEKKGRSNNKEVEGKETATSTDASSFAEERASLLKNLLGKLSNDEELSDEEKEDLLDGMADDFNGAGKKLLKEVEGVLAVEDTRPGFRNYADEIRRLNEQLESFEENSVPADKGFWKGLHDLSKAIKPKVIWGKGDSESSKEFLETPKKLLDNLDARFKNSETKLVVALRVKELGHRVDQAGDDKIRLQANITELLAARVLLSIVDECDEIQNQFNRIGFQSGSAAAA